MRLNTVYAMLGVVGCLGALAFAYDDIVPLSAEKRSPSGCKTKTVADILFILDASGSVGSGHFRQELDFASKVITNFPLGPKSVQIGVITFSSSVHPFISFNAHYDVPSLTTAIQGIPYNSGGTNTAAALAWARNFGFTSQFHARPLAEAPHIAVVITDGKSNSKSATIGEAKALQASKTTVLAIGVGNGVDNQELNDIASSANLVFTVSDFNALDSIKTTITNSVCAVSSDATTQQEQQLQDASVDEKCVSKSCKSMADGDYPACKPECEEGIYYTCSNQILFKRDCALGWYSDKNNERYLAKTVFDPKTKRCEWESTYCPREEAQHAKPIQPTGPSQEDFFELSSGKCVPASCTSKSDGDYPACDPDCGRGIFYTCTNKKLRTRECPQAWYIDGKKSMYTAKMVFDPTFKKCTRGSSFCPRQEDNDIIKSGPACIEQVSGTGLGIQITGGAGAISVNGTCEKTNCKSLPDGDYAACQPECQKGVFYTCSNQMMHKRDCALGWYLDDANMRYTTKLVFDPVKRRCEWESKACPRPEDNDVIKPGR